MWVHNGSIIDGGALSDTASYSTVNAHSLTVTVDSGNTSAVVYWWYKNWYITKYRKNHRWWW